MSDTDLRIRSEDVSQRSDITYSILAELLALAGFVPLSVGTGLFDLLLTLGSYALLVAWMAFGFVFALLINLLLKTIRRGVVGQDFKKFITRHRKYQFGLIAIFFFPGVIALIILDFQLKQLAFVSYILAGLSYILMGPATAVITQQFIKPNNEARLFILQFLRESNSHDPNYSWLRNGLRQIERTLPTRGITVNNRNELFLGCCYQIFNGIHVEQHLIDLSEWIVNPAPISNSSIQWFLQSAAKARVLGLSPTPTLIDKFFDGIRSLPNWWPIGWIVLVSLLLYLGTPASIIDELKRLIP